MRDRDKLVAVAAGEVGVKESPAGSNRVKYNTWFYGREVSGSSYPWCCAFVCWCFHETGMDELIRKTGGCTTMMNWFKARGRLVPIREAQPGDLVFYQFDKDSYADHIGVVEKVTKTGVTAIEGNTSLTSNDNGGAVMRRSRKWSVIMAVGRPEWSNAELGIRNEGQGQGEALKGEDEMSEKEIRELVADTVRQALEPKVYDTVEACPQWARAAVAWAAERGYIKGDEHGRLGLDNTKVWALQVAYNVMERRRE